MEQKLEPIKSNSNQVITNMFWRFTERCGVQGINFIVSILLARVLLPEEYGTVALVSVFISILQVFVNSGFPGALIQKRDATNLDFSTVFYFNIVSCTIMYIILYFLAPSIARFYENELLTSIVRVLGIKLIISGLLAVQNAYVSRTMQFKKYFYATLSGTVISAIVGVTMVYSGYGVWALVVQALVSAVANTIVLWFTSGFKPSLVFSFDILKGLFSFGWKLLIANLINSLYNNLRTLIIGKVYSASDLAYYNKGEKFPQLIINNLNTSIDSVLFPTMAQAQDEVSRLRIMTRKSIRTSGYLVWPCMVGLFVCAEPIIVCLLTENWLPCVPYFQLFTLSYGFIPIQTANLNAMKALGRSDVFLKLQSIGKVVGLFTILISMQFGVYAIAVGSVVVSIFEMFIKASANKDLIGYGYLEQAKDVLPSMGLSALMGCCVWWLQYLALPLLMVLGIQVITGAMIYILLSLIFKIDTFFYVWRMVKEMLSRLVRKVKK